MNIFIDASRTSVHQHERSGPLLLLSALLQSPPLPPVYSVVDARRCTVMHGGRTRNKLTSNAVHGAR